MVYMIRLRMIRVIDSVFMVMYEWKIFLILV